jgi:hypothetical protein
MVHLGQRTSPRLRFLLGAALSVILHSQNFLAQQPLAAPLATRLEPLAAVKVVMV